MEPARKLETAPPGANSSRANPSPRPHRPSRLRVIDIQLYRVCEDFTEALIYLMVLFAPWAFGTTQHWSIWTMNVAGYILGLLLAVKLWIRWVKGFRPSRWGARQATEGTEAQGVHRGKGLVSARVLSPVLGVLTVLIVLYCLTSVLNARSTYDPKGLSFLYHSYVKWLPHSLDSGRSWLAFWSYLALACAFWSIWDWLPGKSEIEERAGHGPSRGRGRRYAPLLPARLRRLLWVLSVNGGLLAVEGIAQRLQGGGTLLFLVKPHVNPGAESQFGPWAYRANASAFFNLLWPVCLGFWWTLHRTAGFNQRVHHLLLVCAALMAACPVISTSRGGAIITVGILVSGTVFLLGSHLLLGAPHGESRKSRGVTLGVVALFFACALALGFGLGWKALKPRMATIAEDAQLRETMYENARPMARDYPLFGTGPGTFGSVFQLYRISTDTYWPEQLHNDWLETRITFGWFGSALIALAFLTVMLRWFARGGIHGGRRLVVLMWLAIGGCLLHARYDFPFQIYSILFLFLILCAILFNLTRRAH